MILKTSQRKIEKRCSNDFLGGGSGAPLALLDLVGVVDEAQAFSRDLYTVVAGLVEGEALDMVKGSHGILQDARTSTSRTAFRRHLPDYQPYPPRSRRQSQET